MKIEVLVAIVLMLQWSKQLPESAKFDMLDLFAGAANGSKFWFLGFASLHGAETIMWVLCLFLGLIGACELPQWISTGART